MTSLYPGTLFNTPGLNRKSTPTRPGVTPEELNKRYKRMPYNGRPWPPPSPLAGIYDIGNSSTQLIIMNNRVRKNSKLRGRNDPNQEPDRMPNPERHSRVSSPVNKEFHTNCLNSQSPRYTPSVCSELEWTNATQRPPAKFQDGSAVNPKRHTSCRVPTDPTVFRTGMLPETPRRPASRLSLPTRFQASPLLTHPELKPGERAYLTHIARIYSAGQMIKLKQDQYNQLLFREMEKGLYSPKEVERYGRFINMGQDRQYQILRPAKGFRRAMSAPPQNYHMYSHNVSSSTQEESSFETEKSSDPKNTSSSSDEKEQKGKKPTTGAPRSLSQKQVSPRSRSPQMYRTSNVKPSGRRIPASAKSSRSNDSAVSSKDRKKEEEKKEEVSDSTTSNGNSSDTNTVEDSHVPLHREGVDRPKSRLGHASARTAADEQKTSDQSDSSVKDNTTESSSACQKAPPPSPKEDLSSKDSDGSDPMDAQKSSEEKRLTPVLETSAEQSDSSESSKVKGQSSDQQISSDDSVGQQRTNESNNQQRTSSDESESQHKSDESGDQQILSSDDSEAHQKSDESNEQQKSLDDSPRQDTSVAEDYSKDEDHSKSEYTTSEETQQTKSTTEDTYTSPTTTQQDTTATYTSSAQQEPSPRDNTESTADDTYTMTYDTSAEQTDNTVSENKNFSTEKSSSAEDKTTTSNTDDTKTGNANRRDSLELDDLDDPRHLTYKDVDKIEY